MPSRVLLPQQIHVPPQRRRDTFVSMATDASATPSAANETGSTMSRQEALKEELRQKIKKKYADRGYDIQPESKKPILYELTEEEKEKKNRRRKQNRDAALRCRKKKKIEEKAVYDEYDYELERNASQREEIQRLTRESEYLWKQLQRHTCCLKPPTDISQDAHAHKQAICQVSSHLEAHAVERETTRTAPGVQGSCAVFHPSSALARGADTGSGEDRGPEEDVEGCVWASSVHETMSLNVEAETIRPQLRRSASSGFTVTSPETGQPSVRLENDSSQTDSGPVEFPLQVQAVSSPRRTDGNAVCNLALPTSTTHSVPLLVRTSTTAQGPHTSSLQPGKTSTASLRTHAQPYLLPAENSNLPLLAALHDGDVPSGSGEKRPLLTAPADLITGGSLPVLPCSTHIDLISDSLPDLDSLPQSDTLMELPSLSDLQSPFDSSFHSSFLSPIGTTIQNTIDAEGAAVAAGATSTRQVSSDISPEIGPSGTDASDESTPFTSPQRIPSAPSHEQQQSGSSAPPREVIPAAGSFCPLSDVISSYSSGSGAQPSVARLRICGGTIFAGTNSMGSFVEATRDSRESGDVCPSTSTSLRDDMLMSCVAGRQESRSPASASNTPLASRSPRTSEPNETMNEAGNPGQWGVLHFQGRPHPSLERPRAAATPDGTAMPNHGFSPYTSATQGGGRFQGRGRDTFRPDANQAEREARRRNSARGTTLSDPVVEVQRSRFSCSGFNACDRSGNSDLLAARLPILPLLLPAFQEEVPGVDTSLTAGLIELPSDVERQFLTILPPDAKQYIAEWDRQGANTTMVRQDEVPP